MMLNLHKDSQGRIHSFLSLRDNINMDNILYWIFNEKGSEMGI